MVGNQNSTIIWTKTKADKYNVLLFDLFTEKGKKPSLFFMLSASPRFVQDMYSFNCKSFLTVQHQHMNMLHGHFCFHKFCDYELKKKTSFFKTNEQKKYQKKPALKSLIPYLFFKLWANHSKHTTP